MKINKYKKCSKSKVAKVINLKIKNQKLSEIYNDTIKKNKNAIKKCNFSVIMNDI